MSDIKQRNYDFAFAIEQVGPSWTRVIAMIVIVMMKIRMARSDKFSILCIGCRFWKRTIHKPKMRIEIINGVMWRDAVPRNPNISIKFRQSNYFNKFIPCLTRIRHLKVIYNWRWSCPAGHFSHKLRLTECISGAHSKSVPLISVPGPQQAVVEYRLYWIISNIPWHTWVEIGNICNVKKHYMRSVDMYFPCSCIVRQIHYQVNNIFLVKPLHMRNIAHILV